MTVTDTYTDTETLLQELQDRIKLLEHQATTERGKIISFRVTKNYHQRLRAVAAQRSMTMSALIVSTLEGVMPKEEN